jgi:TPR repeat protein
MYLIKKRIPLFITSLIVLSLYGCSSSDSDNINSSAKMKQNSISSTQKCISFDTKGQHKEAFPYCKIAAEMGNSFAQTLVGSMYFRGEGIAQSYEQAAIWFQKVAQDGDVNAQAQAG